MLQGFVIQLTSNQVGSLVLSWWTSAVFQSSTTYKEPPFLSSPHHHVKLAATPQFLNMNTTSPSLEFDLGLLYGILHDLSLYYLASTVFLIILSARFAVWVRDRRPLVVPFYGLNRTDKDAPKKRWMRDSINLLQEGYRKVIYFPACSETSQELTAITSSFKISHFKSGLRKETMLFFLRSSCV